MKQKLISGDEMDCFSSARHFLGSMRRAGARKTIKRKVNKRFRRDGKQEVRQQP